MGKRWGVIYNSVANMRSEPRHGAELLSQTLLGTIVEVLEEQEEWRKIQTPERYTGWVIGSLQPVSNEELAEYKRQPKLIVTALYTRAWENASEQLTPVSDLVAGNILAIQNVENRHYKVGYPDGRQAYVKKEDALPVEEWLAGIELTGESIVASALQLKGVPYLWGGTSTKGIDCSGLTKHTYFMHGIILSRDAWQQAIQGERVDEGADFSNVLPGDLLFFGSKASDENSKERVVHVGIYMDNKRFVHASDYVRVSSFDPSDPLYDAFNRGRYLYTKRIIDKGQIKRVETVRDHPLYNSSTI
mgnify:FL=1